MNANASNSTFLKPWPPPHVSCFPAKVIPSMDLHIERLYIQMDGEEGAERSHWAALRDEDRRMGKLYFSAAERGRNGQFCHISKGSEFSAARGGLLQSGY